MSGSRLTNHFCAGDVAIQDATKRIRVNRQIRISPVRVIGHDGGQLGIMEVDKAMALAEEHGLDLVEVAPTARPPVVRVMDFGKFKYAQKKKERGTGVKASLLKELRVRPAIDRHDLEYRLKQGREFLEEGHKVQVVCVFKGRQLDHFEHGYKVM